MVPVDYGDGYRSEWRSATERLIMTNTPKSPQKADIITAVMGDGVRPGALPSATLETALGIYDMLRGYSVAPIIGATAQAGTAVIRTMLNDGTLPIKRANAETVTATYVVGDGPERERVGMNLTKTTRRLRVSGFPTCYVASPTIADGRRVVVPYHGPAAK